MTDDSQAGEAARLLGVSHEVAARWLVRVERSILANYAGQIQEWRSLLHAHHGCWCGAGHLCEDEVDRMDSCCHQHDLAYDSLGVSVDTMWSAAALMATRYADRALVECVDQSRAAGEDAAVEAYRAMLMRIFSSRAEIGELLAALP